MDYLNKIVDALDCPIYGVMETGQINSRRLPCLDDGICKCPRFLLR